MCGGIAGALGQALPPAPPLVQAARATLYSLGRITSYALAGALVGAAGEAFAAASGLGLALRVAAGLLIVGVGLHVGGLWRGLAGLERTGLTLWRRLAPLMRRLGRPDRSWKLFAMGALWGWLPCGLVYSSLAAASALGGASTGALFMLGFGLGTLPALVLASGLARTLRGLLQARATRAGAAALLVGFGLWTISAAAAPHVSGSSPHAHGVHVADVAGGDPAICGGPSPDPTQEAAASP
jgi:sulfite exporter TauE/SafE